jgi:hypothetical protein
VRLSEMDKSIAKSGTTKMFCKIETVNCKLVPFGEEASSNDSRRSVL